MIGGSQGGKLKKVKVLLLGGNGSVGKAFRSHMMNLLSTKDANRDVDEVTIYSVSRSEVSSTSPPVVVGSTSNSSSSSNGNSFNLNLVKCDASDKQAIEDVVKRHGPFDCYVHMIGALFDDSSGLGWANKFMSGSGSVPSKGSSYDKITRVTAFNLLDTILDNNASNDSSSSNNNNNSSNSSSSSSSSSSSTSNPSFVFISAQETQLAKQWFTPDFQARYLDAKRAVEGRLLTDISTRSAITPVIVRPGVIYDWNRFSTLFPAAFMYVGSRILPSVFAPPTNIKDLTDTIGRAVLDSVKKEK